ncbi:MAG: MATE family efflux transporter [Halieaceae bacterium]|jgi:MATE family multidrug resistance protein|nr:MATE family efflux transporter [Halieaceae bacterium]
MNHAAIWQKAWPIILANAAVPLLGLADTAVIGNLGNLAQLGAIAFGAMIFSFIYWSFGFLRMGTTGFTAQAAGAGDEAEIRATLARALMISVGLGLVVILLQGPLARIALALLEGSAEVEAITRDYFTIRIWGAPATLSVFALTGCLIGLGKSRLLLLVQLFLNGLNILLDVLFAGVFGWGAQGIALGTVIAEWLAVLLAAGLVIRLLRQRQADAESFWPWPRIGDARKMLRLMAANTDILLRTLLLLFSFAWFINQSARFGDAVLGANHILLQLVSFSAFFLDGYAFVTEALVGEALGAKRRQDLAMAVRRSSELAAATAVILALLIVFFGELAIAALTNIDAVRVAAGGALVWAGLYVLLSFAAFQLDGIFIGATRTREMRNASFVSVLVFMLAWWWLTPLFGNHGLWCAFVIYVCARALALAAY